MYTSMLLLLIPYVNCIPAGPKLVNPGVESDCAGVDGPLVVTEEMPDDSLPEFF